MGIGHGGEDGRDDSFALLARRACVVWLVGLRFYYHVETSILPVTRIVFDIVADIVYDIVGFSAEVVNGVVCVIQKS